MSYETVSVVLIQLGENHFNHVTIERRKVIIGVKESVNGHGISPEMRLGSHLFQSLVVHETGSIFRNLKLALLYLLSELPIGKA